MLGLREAEMMEQLWRRLIDSAREPRSLHATQVLRTAARRLRPAAPTQDEEFGSLFPLTESERHYVANGYDDRTPLPPGAEATLTRQNPHLLELQRRFGALDLPVVRHHMWTPERVSALVDLARFRGDNLYLWHYPEHPRSMGLVLFIYMRYLESKGGRELLDRLDEDGAFGAWTVDVPLHGKLSRDLLDSVNEILFLDRHIGALHAEELRILDVGAGYGRLAHRAATAISGLADYCCVDAIPESTFLSEYYLDYRGCAPPARVVGLDDVAGLKPGTFDIAVNIHSFSECTLAAISWWAEQLARLRVPKLFVVPNEPDGLRSREVGGGYHDALPTLAEAGYELEHTEPAISDPAVREFIRINDNHMLFSLADAH
jgi:SAM-dependent methyltransferase